MNSVLTCLEKVSHSMLRRRYMGLLGVRPAVEARRERAECSRWREGREDF